MAVLRGIQQYMGTSTARSEAIVDAIAAGYPAAQAKELFANPLLRTADDIKRVTRDHVQHQQATSTEERLKKAEETIEMLTKGGGLAGQRFGGPNAPLAGGLGPRNDAESLLERMASDGYEETAEDTEQFQRIFGF